MIFSLVMLFVGYLLTIFFTVSVHELLHFLPALLLGRSPKLGLEYRIVPIVRYVNNGNDYQNLFISCLPSVVLVALGLLENGDGPYRAFFKMICMLNVFNVLPITSDGEVIMLSVLKIIRGK